MIRKTILGISAFSAAFVGASLIAQTPSPAPNPTPPPAVETCDTPDVPKKEAELRAVNCPDGFVGQWYQERSAGSCEWQPKEPQWYACSEIIVPEGTPPPPMDPPPK